MNLGKLDFARNLVVAVVTLSLLPLVWGHGRLMDPPARNSMWRWIKDVQFCLHIFPIGLATSILSTTTTTKFSVEE